MWVCVHVYVGREEKATCKHNQSNQGKALEKKPLNKSFNNSVHPDSSDLILFLAVLHIMSIFSRIYWTTKCLDSILGQQNIGKKTSMI